MANRVSGPTPNQIDRAKRDFFYQTAVEGNYQSETRQVCTALAAAGSDVPAQRTALRAYRSNVDSNYRDLLKRYPEHRAVISANRAGVPSWWAGLAPSTFTESCQSRWGIRVSPSADALRINGR